MNRVYLDHNATSPLLPSVASAMSDLLSTRHTGNPSSLHGDGRRSRKIIEESRDKIADCLGVDSSEIIFTSGGTESNNLALGGLVNSSSAVSASSTEHPSILEVLKRLHAAGRSGSIIPVDTNGRVIPEEVPDNGIVSIQWINNETGICQDLESLAEFVHTGGGHFHSDGAQGFFRKAYHLGDSPLDSASITAHKAGGPTGVGVLWIRKGSLVEPTIHGGPQEKKIRPGTENLLAIHGIGVLAENFQKENPWNLDLLQTCRANFLEHLKPLEGTRYVQHDSIDWPGWINVSVEGVHAETLLVRLDMAGISASSGSACSSGAREPSHVLKAMSVPGRMISGSIRLSLGPESTPDMAATAGNTIVQIVRELRTRTQGQPPVL